MATSPRKFAPAIPLLGRSSTAGNRSPHLSFLPLPYPSLGTNVFRLMQSSSSSSNSNRPGNNMDLQGEQQHDDSIVERKMANETSHQIMERKSGSSVHETTTLPSDHDADNDEFFHNFASDSKDAALKELHHRAKHTTLVEGGKRLVENLEKLVERVGKKGVEQAAERAGSHVAQQTGEQLLERSSERLAQVAGERWTERTGERMAERAAERLAEQAGERLAERSGERFAEQSGEHIVERLAKRAGERMVEQAGERLAEQSGERLAERAGEKFAEKASESLAERAGEQLTKKLGESITEHAGERFVERSGERLAEEAGERIAERAGKNVIERAGEHLAERTGEQAAARTGERLAERTGGRFLEQGAERLVERATDSAASKTGVGGVFTWISRTWARVSGKSGVKSIEQGAERTAERVAKNAAEQGTERAIATAAGRQLILRRIGRGALIAIPALGGLFAAHIFRLDLLRAKQEYAMQRKQQLVGTDPRSKAWLVFGAAAAADGIDAICHFVIVYALLTEVLGHHHLMFVESVSLCCAIGSTAFAVSGELLSQAKRRKKEHP